MTRRQLEKKLDKVFSEYIRRRDSGANGWGVCFTCAAPVHWKQGHCGHFIRRSHRTTRWSESNCHLQCVKCNTYRGGEEGIAAERIEEEHGAEELKRLQTLRYQSAKFSSADLQAMILYFTTRLRLLNERRDAQR